MMTTIRRRFAFIIAVVMMVSMISTLVFLPVSAAPAPNCSAYTSSNNLTCNCHIPDPNNKGACLDQYYMSNAISLYDPNAKSCNSTTPGTAATTSISLLGNSRPEQMFRFLLSKGLTAEQAAGIMGNLQAESGFDPAIEQGGRIVGANYVPIPNVGFGIAQWTSPGRQVNLMAFQKSSGLTIIDLSMQLGFLWDELSHGAALPNLKLTTTPEDAAYIFHRDFEISADSAATVRTVRGGNARAIYEQFKSLAPTTASVNPALSAGVATDTCSRADSSVGSNANLQASATNPMSDSWLIYNQCQYEPYGGPWGTNATLGGRTVCQDGCIPTALAMLSKDMVGNNTTPQETANYFTGNNLWNGSGGSLTNAPLTAADHFGLAAATINKDDIAAYKAVFDSGGVIMAIAYGASPFLPQGHAILLRGITADGKSFLIADPGQKETNVAPLNQPSIDSIMSTIRSNSSSVVYGFHKK